MGPAYTQPPDGQSSDGQPFAPGELVRSANGSGVARLPPEAELATMRQMMETLFARVETLQQNQAMQFSGVHDRLDAVELELPLIQEQGALRIRDLEARMAVEIEEAARSVVEDVTAGLQEDVAGKFGLLTAQIEIQRKELSQMRESRKLAESKLNRVVLDIERLCGNLASGPAPGPADEAIRPTVEAATSPFRTRIAEHIRKAAVDAAPDVSNPLVGQPASRTAPQPAPTVPFSAAVPLPAKHAVPGFDDWKRQFMQEGEPAVPTLDSKPDKASDAVICPRCYSDRTRPAAHGWLDGVFRVTGFTPYRCRSCAHRFYRRGAPMSEAHAEEAVETR